MKELFLNSTIVQGLVTLVLVCTVAYLCVTGQEVPDILTQALFMVLGFWFGSKLTVASRTTQKERSNNNGQGL
jgi:hypothetical protein